MREPVLPPEHEAIVTEALGCAIAVHRELGPGFREHVYHRAMCLELDAQGVEFASEKQIEVKYKSWMIPGHRIDLIVRNVVLIELKAVPELKRVHLFQVRSYLKATGLKVGLLLNFNTPYLKEGIRRIVI